MFARDNSGKGSKPNHSVLRGEYNRTKFSAARNPRSDVTRILSQIESGDPAAAEQLLPLVYNELRKLAAAKLAQE